MQQEPTTETLACPVIDHLACKFPGTLEPRKYDVFGEFTIPAGTQLPRLPIAIGNRDAPFHAVSYEVQAFDGAGPAYWRVYDSRIASLSDSLVRIELPARNGARPLMPSLVWPVNGTILIDFQNDGGAEITLGVFFYGFKLYDRGKVPC